MSEQMAFGKLSMGLKNWRGAGVVQHKKSRLNPFKKKVKKNIFIRFFNYRYLLISSYIFFSSSCLFSN